MKENETVEKELKRIWNGFLYHCSELSDFMVKNKDDTFFDTSMGKMIRKNALDLMLAHTTGMLFMMDSKNEGCISDFDMEDLLKKRFE